MRTKKEIIDFLESKVGGGVKCIGNPSLDSQCVTLIKSLMEFLGVPNPYKARGHAKTVISAYLSEGIAKPGMGFLSVFSNKNMGLGYGHVWVNAGEGKGTFYESNGVKPLIVTKGKTYAYDAVCNFDQYIKEVTTENIDQLKADLAEQQKQVKNYSEQVTGLLLDITTWEKKYNEENKLRIEAEANAKGFRTQYNEYLAKVAQKLDTRQEEVETLSAIDTLVTKEDDLTELLAQKDTEKALQAKEYQYTIETLTKEVTSLKTQLANLEAKIANLPKPNNIIIPKRSIIEFIMSLFKRS